MLYELKKKFTQPNNTQTHTNHIKIAANILKENHMIRTNGHLLSSKPENGSENHNTSRESKKKTIFNCGASHIYINFSPFVCLLQFHI